jgi:hypothetical protein
LLWSSSRSEVLRNHRGEFEGDLEGVEALVV